MSTPFFMSQTAVSAPGEERRARIVSKTLYPNTHAAWSAWEALRADVDPRVVILTLKTSPVRSGSGYRSGLVGFRLISTGTADHEAVARQVSAMNTAAAARTHVAA